MSGHAATGLNRISNLHACGRQRLIVSAWHKAHDGPTGDRSTSGRTAASKTGLPQHADRQAYEPHIQRHRAEEVMSTAAAGYSHSDPQVAGVSGPGGFWDLMHSAEQEQPFVAGRAPSAMDAGALRRKGHLKEQDFFIDFMQRMHETCSCIEVMTKMERWIQEHRRDPKRSRLRRLLPRLGTFFTPLHLRDAFREYDSVFALSRRSYIPPNFAELRHILGIAQVHACAPHLKLITFDADGTLHADGQHFSQDNAMIDHIVQLLLGGVHVAVVTAAAYPGDAQQYEQRLAGLLGAFREQRLPPTATDRFLVMGGECSYLLGVTPNTYRLEFIPDAEWQLPEMLAWQEKEIQGLLRDARSILVECGKRLDLQMDIVQKDRCVGIVPHQTTLYEVLEDIALTVQNQLQAKLPFCAFNSGRDVCVDVGSKSLGLQCLMAYLDTQPHETLHVGDRFTLSGNDAAVRDVCCVLWVANPEETGFFIKLLLSRREEEPVPAVDLLLTTPAA